MTVGPPLDAAFQARHLAVPMTQAFSLAPSMPVSAARSALAEQGFDQAPVVADGRPLGFVLIKDLQGDGSTRTRDVMHRLGTGNVVSGDASVSSLLEWIVDPGFLFVLEGRDVSGFITVFDFNKQPARAHLYLLLARLESGLADLISRRFVEDPDQALDLVTAAAKPDILERYEADVREGKESELLAYFDFSDLISVVRGDATLLGTLGRSRSSWRTATGGMVDLRNQVMHPVRNVVLTKGGLMKLRDREQRIRELVGAVDRALEVVAT